MRERVKKDFKKVERGRAGDYGPDHRQRLARVAGAERTKTLCRPEFTRVFGWYDNEWGFTNRMIGAAPRMARREREEITDVA